MNYISWFYIGKLSGTLFLGLYFFILFLFLETKMVLCFPILSEFFRCRLSKMFFVVRCSFWRNEHVTYILFHDLFLHIYKDGVVYFLLINKWTFVEIAYVAFLVLYVSWIIDQLLWFHGAWHQVAHEPVESGRKCNGYQANISFRMTIQ